MPELEPCKVGSNGISSIGGFSRFFETARRRAMPSKAPETKKKSKKNLKNKNH
jgi:hypothetical protein